MKAKSPLKRHQDKSHGAPAAPVASPAPAALSQQVLRTDVAGMPLEWIDYR